MSTKLPAVIDGQGKHQEETKSDAENRNQRHERAAKGPMHLRIGFAHDQHGGANDHECQQGADVDQLGEHAQEQKRAHEIDGARAGSLVFLQEANVG